MNDTLNKTSALASKKKRKALLVVVLLFIALVVVAIIALNARPICNAFKLAVYGNAHPEVQVVAVHEDTYDFEGVGKVSVNQALTDGKKTYKLPKSFDDKDASIEQLNSSQSGIVDLMRTHFLFPFSVNSWDWKLYQWMVYVMYDRSDCPDWYKESSGVAAFDQFFDVAEDEEAAEDLIVRAKCYGLGSVEEQLAAYQ